MSDNDKSKILERRMTDNRRTNSISLGQLWEAIVTYREAPAELMAFLLYLILPDQSSEANFKFLMQSIGFRMPGLPTTLAEYDQLIESKLFKVHRSRLLSGSRATPGRDLYEQTRDDALSEIITSDPGMFMRRAKSLSETAELMLTAAQMMLSGGGQIQIDTGHVIEVPGLELNASLTSVRTLVDTSNSLFEQVSRELVDFKEHQREEERESQRELEGVDNDILIAIYALEQMNWSPAEVKKRLGVAVVQDEKTQEIQMRKVQGQYVIADVED